MVDPHEHPDASPEARRALVEARHHRAATEAVLPLAERLRDRMRELNESNHFAQLLENTLAAAARRR